MKKISLLMAVLLVLSLVNMDAFAANDTVKTDTLAKISELKGDASIVKEATQKTIKAFKNMKLSEGDKVITTKDAQLRMFLENKILVIVEGSSEVIVRKNSKNKETQGYERLLELKTGSLVVVADKKLQNQEKLEVKTQTMVAGVRGTSFGIVSKPDHYYIEVYEGVVSLKPNKEYYKDNPAISNLQPILITKHRTKLIKYNSFEKDYKAAPKKTQEPLIYPNVLLRFREDVDYYGKYKSDLKEKQAQENLKPDMKQAMESRRVDVMGNKFTFEKAYGFKKDEEKVIAGGGGGGGGSSGGSGSGSGGTGGSTTGLANIDYWNEPIPNGTYKETVMIDGGSHNITVVVKNGKIRSINTPTLTGTASSNAIGLARGEIEKKNAINLTSPNVGNPTVRPFVEAVSKALTKTPEPVTVTGLQDGDEWYGQGRGNARYDIQAGDVPMEVKLDVVPNGPTTSINKIEHVNFGDAEDLKPASAALNPDGTQTYEPIRTAVKEKQGTDFVKKAVLKGENAEGLSDSDKVKAGEIYADVINGAIDSQEIKKRQKSAIGYINAIDNAIERARAGHITVFDSAGTQRQLRSLKILPEFFEQDDNRVYYRKTKDMADVLIPAKFTNNESGFVKLSALQNAVVQIRGDDNTIYNDYAKTLRYREDLTDYSVNSKFELYFNHRSGLNYETYGMVTRGVDKTNEVFSNELILGKDGENLTIPIGRDPDNHVAKNYLLASKPSFMQQGAIDTLKIKGDDGTIFDLTQNHNKIGGNMQLALTQDVSKPDPAYNLSRTTHMSELKILNNPAPNEYQYKLSDIEASKGFDMNFYSEFRGVQLVNPAPNFRIKIAKGKKLSEGEFQLSDGSLGGVLNLRITSTSGNIENNLEIRRYEDLRKWGFYTHDYFDTPVPLTHMGGVTETKRLYVKKFDELGNLVEHDTGIDIQIFIPI